MHNTIKYILCQYKQILTTLLFASLFFTVRWVFITPQSYNLGEYSDFTTISFYLSDILLIGLLFIYKLPRGIYNFQKNPDLKDAVVSEAPNKALKHSYILLVFWLILEIFLNYTGLNSFQTFSSIRWVTIIFVAYETIRFNVSHATLSIQQILKGFLFFSFFQGILAILQFFLQKSLGLYFVGESKISPIMQGVAKIALEDGVYMRAYGTFPHPNVLGAFLAISLLICSYFLFNSTKLSHKMLLTVVFFVNSLGLLLTFSRAAVIAYIFAILLLFLISSLKKKKAQWAKEFIIVPILTLFSLGLIFSPFIATRATVSDPASTERKEYIKIGLAAIKSNPIWGLGVGESVLHMEQYSGRSLNSWEKQPVHNYFILAGAELGIPGLLIIIFIIFGTLKKLTITLKEEKYFTESALLICIFICILLLMQFDHYFYTLNQPQLLLWGFLAVIAGIKKSPKGDFN